MIAFQNVAVEYQGRTSLDDVSLTIDAGEFVYILGMSGAGKSTLLKLLYLDLLPTRGTITIGEFSSTHIRKKEIPFRIRQRAKKIFLSGNAF